jgi:glycosyltransferase involved in cell wall biosynthesis
LFEDLSINCRLLEDSGLFDAQTYSVAAGLGDQVNHLEHYLSRGWQLGLEPGPNFDGAFLQPYFRSAGFSGPPAVTYLILRAAGWPVYATRAEAEQVAALIRNSGLFDENAYVAHLYDRGLDPILHYILVGERLGYAPSESFDPAYYAARYPDIAQAGMNYLAHYVLSGRQEGRRSVSVASQLTYDTSRLNSARETVLLISHQASRTGAPILAYNIAAQLRKNCNVVVLLLSGGDLIDAFKDCCTAVVGPLNHQDWNAVEAEYLVKRLLASYDISYSIANSIDSRIMLKPLACALIPVVTLVHEFPTYLRIKGEMGRALEWSTQTVFSTEAVLASVRVEYPNVDNWLVHVLPQGPSDLPAARDAKTHRNETRSLHAAMRPEGDEDAFVVLGCGTIYLRKGVDLFLSCAAAVAKIKTKRPVRFVWIGQRLPPHVDADYSIYLSEQIARSGLTGKAVILDEVADLDPAYAMADVFFLSSRLDALPNVAIDSALRGKPVICFDNAGGMADVLKTDETTRISVVPHLDVQAAADLIVRLADNDEQRRKLANATRRLSRATFDMSSYVRRIHELGHDSIRIMRQREEDLATIAADPMFDMMSFIDRDAQDTTRDGAIRLFLARAAALGTNKEPTANFYYRRPCPGFHPQIYAHENKGRYDAAVINPLAHFIRSGKPEGPWRHEVITPADMDKPEKREPAVRAALHAHLFYPALASGFLEKMAANTSRCDLLVTTNDDVKAAELRKTMVAYDAGEVTIRVVPNRGRDIGPFLAALTEGILDRYDVVGHVHSKRSLFTGALLGETWREFLWQNLLGGLHPMMDIILARFQADKKLGIVFPDDPHLPDWDKNLTIAKDLAVRMGIAEPLPPYFNFPVGSMFWARTKALTPLVGLKLGWDDYPKEPVPIDGTILHAIERLLPFATRHAGFEYATIHVPGVTW